MSTPFPIPMDTELRYLLAANDPVPWLKPKNARHPKTLYKYLSMDTAEKVLNNGTLRWSNPVVFNDPFDSKPDFEWSFSAEDLATAYGRYLAPFIESGTIPKDIHGASTQALLQMCAYESPEFRKGLAAYFCDAATNQQAMANARKLMADIATTWNTNFTRLRILCLSKRMNSETMWAHYAENHTGIVLAFSKNGPHGLPGHDAHKVVYSNKTPGLPTLEAWTKKLAGTITKEFLCLFDDYLLLKKRSWANEHEWRMVSFDAPGVTGLYSYRPFPPSSLSGIFIGAECSAHAVQAIRRLQQSRYVKTPLYRCTVDRKRRLITYALA